MEKCLFCKIANRELGEIISENNDIFVIADINPLTKGHLLVIPKYHGSVLTDIPDPVLMSLIVYIKKIVSVLGINKYNILQNNKHIQSVDHVHFHIIPYNEEDKKGLSINWEVSEEAKRLVSNVIERTKEQLN